MTQPKIAFIGAGNMAGAIINGLLAQNYPSDKLFIANRSSEKLAAFPVTTSTDNLAMAAQADIIILAVKPYQISEVCEQLQTLYKNQQPVIVSVAAGITLANMAKSLNTPGPLVRAMPNTPCAVGLGATGLCANDDLSECQRQHISAIFDAVGMSAWVESEHQLDVLSTLSGSGPAYFFFMLEAMQAAAVANGLPSTLAAQLAMQTMLGSAMMAQQHGNQFTTLREQVTSPNGTTFAALETFRQHDYASIIQAGMNAALARGQEILKETEN
jgi:pyrroline-5-carboxylate reductase